jgi:hypothetical protein
MHKRNKRKARKLAKAFCRGSGSQWGRVTCKQTRKNNSEKGVIMLGPMSYGLKFKNFNKRTITNEEVN